MVTRGETIPVVDREQLVGSGLDTAREAAFETLQKHEPRHDLDRHTEPTKNQ